MKADKRHEVQALATEAFKAAQANENEHIAYAVGVLTRKARFVMRGVPGSSPEFYARREDVAVKCLQAVQYLASNDSVMEPAAAAVALVKEAALEAQVAAEAGIETAPQGETEHALNEGWGV